MMQDVILTEEEFEAAQNAPAPEPLETVPESPVQTLNPFLPTMRAGDRVRLRDSPQVRGIVAADASGCPEGQHRVVWNKEETAGIVADQDLEFDLHAPYFSALSSRTNRDAVRRVLVRLEQFLEPRLRQQVIYAAVYPARAELTGIPLPCWEQLLLAAELPAQAVELAQFVAAVEARASLTRRAMRLPTNGSAWVHLGHEQATKKLVKHYLQTVCSMLNYLGDSCTTPELIAVTSPAADLVRDGLEFRVTLVSLQAPARAFGPYLPPRETSHDQPA